MKRIYLVAEKMQHRQYPVGKYRTLTLGSRVGHGRGWMAEVRD